jgi:protein DGCR14
MAPAYSTGVLFILACQPCLAPTAKSSDTTSSYDVETRSQPAVRMAAEQSNALVRRSTDTELMPPPAKRIKRPQKVLDEESYVSGISEIIARDFFPGLLETETKQEYLDALESQDTAWIASAGGRLTQLMTPGRKRGRRGTSIQTPMGGSETPRVYGGDTPMSLMSEMSTASTQAPAAPVMDTNMSLDAFQAKYTSEDNESFYKLLDKQNQKRAEKYSWMWRGNKLPSNQLLKQKEVETKLLESRRSLHDDGGKKDRLAIKNSEEKPAMPDGWISKPNNNFMFGPDGVEDSVETVAQRAQVESRAAPKSVVYDNTRMPLSAVAADPKVPPSPSLSAVRDAIAGRPRLTDSESGYDGSETPRVNGYAFVDDEPESQEYEAPLDPIVLGKGDATPNPFKIKEQSKREDLHHRMVDRVAKTKRASSKAGMTGKVDVTPVPKYPSSPRVGVGGLTPAAQRLWGKVGGSGRLGSPSRSDRAPGIIKSRESKLRVGWTPK